MNIEFRSWLLLALWLGAVALRGTALVASPVLPFIISDMNLSGAAAGLVTALPVLCMGLFALPGGALTQRWGSRAAISIGLLLIAVGSAARGAAAEPAGLLFWTAVFGAGIGIAQPALPALVRTWFKDRPATATGIYSSGFLIGVLLASAVTVPWLVPLTGGWRGSFVAWGVYTAAALLFWELVARRMPAAPSSPAGAPAEILPPAEAPPPAPAGRGSAWRAGWVWLLSILYLIQSSAFYTVSSWLPSYYHYDLGWSIEASSLPLTWLAIATVAASLAVPPVIDRTGRPMAYLAAASLLLLAGTAGLIYLPVPYAYVWGVCLGISLAMLFVLCLALPVILRGGRQVAEVSAIMLAVGHTGSIFGPLLAGAFRDATGSLIGGWWLVAADALVILLLCFVLARSERRAESAGRPPGAGRTRTGTDGIPAGAEGQVEGGGASHER